MIKSVIIKGETLINVPARSEILIQLGASEDEVKRIIEKYNQEKELEAIRAYRIPLLKEADYLINLALDKGLNVVPFRAYRQALRDITKQYSSLSEVVWPEKPTL
ncbi:phage tail assembly chaperone [Photobacterium leiognathi]|uniref:phage tail assembly chaperone n=1 Tax=Photobacterium leiognathi TaxID=553611 RepID=UPI0029819647|nr:phage tail assembly chaperone [Photobacterium leiognathi]